MFWALPSKRLSPSPLPFPFPFYFWTYLYPHCHDYAPHHFTLSCLHPCVSMTGSSPFPCNHAYAYVSFLLTSIDIASLAVLSLCAALQFLFPLFPFISLLALKGFLSIYNRLLLLMYLNLDLHQSMCWLIFPHFEALLLLEAFLFELDRTMPLSPFLDETLPLSLSSQQVLTLACLLLAQLCQCSKWLVAGALYPWP